jgi:ABC-type transport system involved in multi-copper enzyme maturation permease subunit
MNATFALIRDTFREAFARRIFWGFFGCCSALLLFLLLVTRVDVNVGGLPSASDIGGAATPAAEYSVLQTQSLIAMLLYYAGTALAVFASAGLVSAMFEPGRIELLLSKPLSRTHLLLGRYLGNVLLVAANILYLIAGSWIIFGIKTGVWGAGFLISSLFTILNFSVLLAVIVLVGVLWDSSAVAIMVTFAIMIVTPILSQIATMDQIFGSDSSRMVVKGLYEVLPKTSELGSMARRVIVHQPIESWMPVWTTALFGAVVLALGVRRFSQKTF